MQIWKENVLLLSVRHEDNTLIYDNMLFCQRVSTKRKKTSTFLGKSQNPPQSCVEGGKTWWSCDNERKMKPGDKRGRGLTCYSWFIYPSPPSSELMKSSCLSSSDQFLPSALKSCDWLHRGRTFRNSNWLQSYSKHMDVDIHSDL